MEDWEAELRQGRPDAAWDRFIHRYRRLIFAAIRYYADGYDDVMDIFAQVSATLRESGMARLLARAEEPNPRARFSTWLVAVVRHLTVDWFRHRDGRWRLSAAVEELPPLQRRVFELVFLDQRSPDGTSLSQLTTSGGRSWAPVWSPDSRTIAYFRYSDADNTEIMLMNADGSEQRRIDGSLGGFYRVTDWKP